MTENDMANICGLLVCLVILQTIQANGESIEMSRNTSTLRLKTFNRRTLQCNLTNQLPISFYPSPHPPELDVSPNDSATSIIRGVLSAQVIPLLYILAMVVGIPSNAYILVFLRVKARSFSTAVLYLSLALSDLLLLLFLPLRVHYHLNGNNWIFGEVACRVITAVFYGNIYCSANTIACISLKRYLAVAMPFLYRRLPKTSLALAACVGVWVPFGAAVVPEFLVQQSYRLSQLGITTCHDFLPLDESTHALLVPYRLALVCIGFIVPFLVCICAHIGILYHLGRSSNNWKPFIRVSTLVFLIFVICFCPSGILHIAHYIHLASNGDDRLYGYYKVAVCLCCFHSSLDPFLCILMSKTTASKLKFIPLRGQPRVPVL